MTTFKEAQPKLPKSFEHPQPEETPVKAAERTSWPCEAGTAKDQIRWISPDFDAPLDDFREYME